MEKKVSVYDRKPVLGTFLYTLFAYLIVIVGSQLIFAMVPSFILASATSLDKDKIELISTIAMAIGGCVVASLMLLWFYKRYKPNFKGIIKPMNDKIGWICFVIMIVYWGIGTVAVAVFSKLGFSGPRPIFLALMAGVTEEIAFRAIPLSFAMKHRDKKNIIIVSTLVTTLFFGLIHLMNITNGQPILTTLFQAVSATLVGIFFAAVFLRTGNILFTIVPHFLNDIIASFDVGNVNTDLMTGTLGKNAIVDIITCVALGVIGLILIRPKKHDDIKKVWDKIWVD